MIIHKEGISFLIYSLLLILLILSIIFIFYSKYIFYIFLFISLIIYSFLIFFFRNPNRVIPLENNLTNKIVLSPADGKVLKIQSTFENEFLKKKCIKISIFMSPLDVHVNRYPISGKIIYKKYYSGKHFLAWIDKSSLDNEHTTIVIKKKDDHKILLRQIAGFLARRIVLYSEKNLIVKKGEELGFIKFGSRIDLFLPKKSKILIKKGENVVGGITKISILPK